MNRWIVAAFALLSTLAAGHAVAQATPPEREAQENRQALENRKAPENRVAQESRQALERREAQEGRETQEDGEAQEDSGDVRVFWRDGLRMETDDGRFQLRFGGRVQYDWVFWGDDAEVADAVALPITDGTEFRRIRFFVQGVVDERFEYKAQLDFAGGEVAVKDLYFGIRHPTYGFRMGHMKEPFGLEEMTSSKYLTFIERGLPVVFGSQRNSGFLLHGNVLGGDFNYGVGVFRDTGDDGIGIGRDAYNVTGRFAGAVIDNAAAGGDIVHLGASGLLQNGDGSLRLFTQRPEVHLSPPFISTGAIPVEHASVLALEGAWLRGPWSAQAEYKLAAVRSEETGDPTFAGWYLYGSYFITGESRAYRNAVFHRVRPQRNFLEDGGLGAFEVAARYSGLDLGADGIDKTDDPIQGTRLDDVTLALNWYWNPLMVMRFNAIHADIDEIGSIWAFVWRGQVAF